MCKAFLWLFAFFLLSYVLSPPPPFRRNQKDVWKRIRTRKRTLPHLFFPPSSFNMPPFPPFPLRPPRLPRPQNWPSHQTFQREEALGPRPSLFSLPPLLSLPPSFPNFYGITCQPDPSQSHTDRLLAEFLSPLFTPSSPAQSTSTI